jgi:sterol desaturase/sphingolipid hydroxylase (fatty acid hydroxylase superfamily)
MLAYEASIRLTVFAAVLLSLSLAELAFAPIPWTAARWQRLRENFGLMLINTLLLRAAFPVLAVQFAMQAHPNGLFSRVALPNWLAIVLAFLALDLLLYAQHRVFHQIDWLWRLHRVHHCDQDFDVSLALRFHPLEIALSMALKLAAIALLGAPAIAVLAFEVALSAGALLTHTRLALPAAIERRARWIVITPSLHRIHHHLETGDQNHNFGTTLSIWDHAFGSFRVDAQSHIEGFGTQPIAEKPSSLIALLRFPFRH